MYGGYAGQTGPGTAQYDELWSQSRTLRKLSLLLLILLKLVLTLPAFQWVLASGVCCALLPTK